MRVSAIVLCTAVLVSLVGCSDDEAQTGSTASTTSGQGGQTGEGGSGPGSGGADGGAGSGTGGEAPEVSLLHQVGRFDTSDPAGPRFTWSGTSFRTRIDGPGVEVSLDGPAGVFFEIVVDGVSTGVIETIQGSQSYTLADALPAGEHDVEIHRRNEGFFGVVQFMGFSPLAGGSIVASPSPYEHRIEFIGDSITCGYGVEGPNATCDFSGDTESAYITYAAIAARNVNAAAHFIAYSGKGVYQNYGGDTNEPMPELYGRTLTASASPEWDFSSFVPDVVVVNLGTNDFSAALDSGAFIDAYVALLGEVRGHYPSASIYCVTWAHWGGTNQGYVLAAIDQFGDAQVSSIEFTIEPEEGFGCDYHPSLSTHERLGAQLTQTLEADLGW
jgi:lysophospholipase L1-like esterase